MKNISPFILALLLVGCEKPSGKWEATQDVSVFKEANDADELKFVVQKGEICALGREQIAKAFMYREVHCDAGSGWIINSGGYPFKKIE